MNTDWDGFLGIVELIDIRGASGGFMIEELDVVVLKEDLTGTDSYSGSVCTVIAGSIGTVVMVFDSPSQAYEVEFVNSDGWTLGIFTLTDDQVELWNPVSQNQARRD